MMMTGVSLVKQTFRDLKDRQLLLGYRAKVDRGSAEERKIDELLNNLVRRRRRRRNKGHLFSPHHVTCLFFFCFSKSGGRTDDVVSVKDFYLQTKTQRK